MEQPIKALNTHEDADVALISDVNVETEMPAVEQQMT